MFFYHVMVGGHGLQILADKSKWVGVGFFKNEYVFANSRETAIDSALHKVKENIDKQVAEGKVRLNELKLEAEDVSKDVCFWKILTQEGFIFYPEG